MSCALCLWRKGELKRREREALSPDYIAQPLHPYAPYANEAKRIVFINFELRGTKNTAVFAPRQDKRAYIHLSCKSVRLFQFTVGGRGLNSNLNNKFHVLRLEEQIGLASVFSQLPRHQ